MLSRMTLALALTATIAAGQAYAICSVSTDVSGSGTEVGATGVWDYSFTVENGCDNENQPFLTDFYIPYFSDAGISDITVPPPNTTTTTSTIAWTYSILPDDDLFDLPGAGVIDFQVTATPELQGSDGQDAPGVGYYGASGFGFSADFAPVEGPYAILQYLPPDYTTTTTLFGDPPIPGSPDTIAALESAAAPEPAPLALMALGIVGLLILTRRTPSSQR